MTISNAWFITSEQTAPITPSVSKPRARTRRGLFAGAIVRIDPPPLYQVNLGTRNKLEATCVAETAIETTFELPE